MKRFLFLFIILNLAFVLPSNGQTKVTGRVVDASGHGIEYATISVDSLFCISDADGHFNLQLPRSVTADINVSHISFKTKLVPRSVFQQGYVNVMLEERAYNLGSVDIVAKQTKLETIVGRGMKLPGDAAFGKEQQGKVEMGPLFSVKRDYVVASFDMKVEECTYQQCVVRLIVYEVHGAKFEPIQSKPLYLALTPANQNTHIKIKTQGDITLKKGSTYYVGVSVVSGSNAGTLHFPAHLRSSYVRNLVKGTFKKLPATLGMVVKGYRI
ncbi:carboxypeptidase-like regulatory domain-containing protein [Prevotella conceptionensis]|jgi:hypothetical protein|uniref:carboxypeptidase-like regulatory domain-containing protein n=1 Tax=Prevotella conceptionensis TaxID=340486 RepID=UPI000310DE43|nr:hypothetical protein [Prevotella conceptionensis]